MVTIGHFAVKCDMDTTEEDFSLSVVPPSGKQHQDLPFLVHFRFSFFLGGGFLTAGSY